MKTLLLTLAVTAFAGCPHFVLAQGTYLNAPNGGRERVLIVDAGARVGIGTENPLAPLQVVGNAENPFLILRPSPNTETADSFTEIRLYGDPYRYENGYAAIRQVNTGGADQNELAFLTAYVDAPVERMRIDDHGNVGIGTSKPIAPLHVHSTTDQFGIRVTGEGKTAQVALHVAPGDYGFLDLGGGTQFRGNGRGSAISGNLQVDGKLTCQVLEVTSDRNTKTKFASLNRSEVLDKLLGLQISEWEYTNAPGVRHYGAMAQDFHAQFGLGSDDKHINPLDAASVAILGVQALAQELKAKDAQIVELKSRLERMDQQLAANSALMGKLLAQLSSGSKGGKVVGYSVDASAYNSSKDSASLP